MSNFGPGSSPASVQNGNNSFNQSWIAFFTQIKKLAAELDELEQAGSEQAEERQF